MAAEEIPSFLSLANPKKKLRRGGKTRPLASGPSQLRFDLPAPLSPPDVAAPIEVSPPLPASLRPAPVRPDPSRPYTVRQLIAELRQHVEGSYQELLNVEGEISNFRNASSGHIYFTLKDGEAQLPVVLFRRSAQLLGFKLKDGLAVEVRGRISLYETRGQLQLIAESLRPRGTGALQIAFEQLRDSLRREGLFDRVRTPLPPFPHCIGVVTSPGGAAIRDIINVVRRRHGRLNILIYPAVMQGPQCSAAVASGVRWFNRHPDRVSMILIARGGGSLEDLAGFNDEKLARTIAASTLPVVTAIGHEIDHTIADFVADLRAPTPSAAAELITAAQHRIEERVAALQARVHRGGAFQLLRARQRLVRLSSDHVLARLHDSISLRHQGLDELRRSLLAALTARFRTSSSRVGSLEQRLRRHDPSVRLTRAQQRLHSADACLQRAGRRLTLARSTRLQQATMRLFALSPLAVLKRGYAIVYLEDSVTGPTLLRDAATVMPQQQIRARLARGSVRASVLDTAPELPTRNEP